MRRLTAWLLMACLPMAVLLFGAPLSAEAEADTMDVMDVILSMKTNTPDLDVLKNCAILARQRYGQAIRRIDYRWDAGRFSAQVTFGSTLSARTPLKDENGRFQAVVGGAEYPYLLSLPNGYDPDRVYPTILFLHGIGERGENPAVIADYGPFQYILAGHEPDMIVIAPQVEKSAHWVEDQDENEVDTQMLRLARFLEQMRGAYAIDDTRVYLTGLSMGGRGAYKLACHLPDAFAAVAICCGRAGKADQPEAIMYDLNRLAGTPVWLFHGLSDETVRPDHALAGARALLDVQEKPNLRLTLYPAVGHGCYEHAYQEDALYAWLAGWEKN